MVDQNCYNRHIVRALPSPNGSNGRLANGRFARGNPGGPGNPDMKRAGEIRGMIRGFVTERDLQDIVRALVKQAKTGDLAAIRELLDRIAGKPAPAQDVEPPTRPHWQASQYGPPPDETPEQAATLEDLPGE